MGETPAVDGVDYPEDILFELKTCSGSESDFLCTDTSESKYPSMECEKFRKIQLLFIRGICPREICKSGLDRGKLDGLST